ncbi:MAG: type II toxin-antitoxin system VapC family toxin [Gaiellaceae bacterium]
MALVVLDASVVIGFLDADDALHDPCVAALAARQDDELVIPASAYAETLVAPYRSGQKAIQEVERFLGDFAIAVGEITRDVARTAARLRSGRAGLRLPDALVIAFGEEAGADEVLTADRTWPKVTSRAVLVKK